ncbi:hypothetical protein NLI96_g7956 [Meripilus lineatus]|uniref:Uncharacterized protein n=1 Tax=Meripilus lineatus TaxID=2056292 RepID=A0AAD5V050_9APHY|nr:hypothetical protein NLI96_g7956 [Physisporinus lineatus]
MAVPATSNVVIIISAAQWYLVHPCVFATFPALQYALYKGAEYAAARFSRIDLNEDGSIVHLPTPTSTSWVAQPHSLIVGSARTTS